MFFAKSLSFSVKNYNLCKLQYKFVNRRLRKGQKIGKILVNYKPILYQNCYTQNKLIRP